MSDGRDRLRNRNVRVRSWKEFRKLVLEKKAKTVVYIIAQSIPASNLTSLKLILPVEGMQYIFVDTAKGFKLRQTNIRIHVDDKDNKFIEDSDVKTFLREQFGRNLKVFSYWTI